MSLDVGRWSTREADPPFSTRSDDRRIGMEWMMKRQAPKRFGWERTAPPGALPQPRRGKADADSIAQVHCKTHEKSVRH